MEDYYPGEIADIVSAWNQIHNPAEDQAEETLSAVEFFGEGGEVIDD